MKRRPAAISNQQSASGLTLLELLVAMAIAAMIMAISFPSVTAGLDGVRLQAAGRSLAAFVNEARGLGERGQLPMEIVIDQERNQVSASSADGRWQRTLEFTSGVKISEVLPRREGDAAPAAPRRVVLLPGVPAPRFQVRLENSRGRALMVGVDPLTGTPQIMEAAP